MNANTKILFGLIACFFAFFLIGVGFLMRKFDFSSMLNHPWKKSDGLYIRLGLKLKRVADDTPENRIKFSKIMGNYFIIFSLFWLIIVIIFIWNL